MINEIINNKIKKDKLIGDYFYFFLFIQKIKEGIEIEGYVKEHYDKEVTYEFEELIKTMLATEAAKSCKVKGRKKIEYIINFIFYIYLSYENSKYFGFIDFKINFKKDVFNRLIIQEDFHLKKELVNNIDFILNDDFIKKHLKG